jgi:hypothetical protein
MAGSIFDDRERSALFARLDRLRAEDRPQWGVMSAAQMVRHLREAIRMYTGELDAPDRSTWRTRTLFRWMTLAGALPPKSALAKDPPRTFKVIDVVRSGIATGGLDEERRMLRDVTEAAIRDQRWAGRHPLFGRMSAMDWGRLMHTHMAYHLRQFGV